MVHELKTLPKYFKAVREGRKTFEVRKDDRGFQVGDTLVLGKWNGQYFTDRCSVKVTYILGRNPDEKMYVPNGYVILGIK
jgi:ASC-1-like (ASCH) protein